MNQEIIPYTNKIITLIEQARHDALKSVNAELIKLYWNVGEYLSTESVESNWGDSFIDETAKYIKEQGLQSSGTVPNEAILRNL